MSTQEVVEMIDAITEGKSYENDFIRVNKHDFCLKFPTGEIVFDQPRGAREIAAALIAWANQKEGTSVDEIIGFLQACKKITND